MQSYPAAKVSLSSLEITETVAIMREDQCCYLCNECPNKSFISLDELERHMSADHANAVDCSPIDVDVMEDKMSAGPSPQASDSSESNHTIGTAVVSTANAFLLICAQKGWVGPLHFDIKHVWKPIYSIR